MAARSAAGRLGEFARLNGARSLADLPGHVDAFVDKRARSPARAAAGWVNLRQGHPRPGRAVARACRPRGCRPLASRIIIFPFAGELPGYWGYVTSERGLRPGVGRPGISTILTASRPGWRASASPGCTSCPGAAQRFCRRAFRRPAWRRPRCGRAAPCCACSCVMPGRGAGHGDLWKTVEWPQVYRLSRFPGRSPGTTSAKCWPPCDRRTPVREAGLRGLAAAGDLRPARPRGRGPDPG